LGGESAQSTTALNRLHFDVAPTDRGHQLAQLDRLAALGAIRIDNNRADAAAVQMSDSDGNRFCLWPWPPA